MPNDDSISPARPRNWQRAPGPTTPPTDRSYRPARLGGVPPMFGFDRVLRPCADVTGQVRGGQTGSGSY